TWPFRAGGVKASAGNTTARRATRAASTTARREARTMARPSEGDLGRHLRLGGRLEVDAWPEGVPRHPVDDLPADLEQHRVVVPRRRVVLVPGALDAVLRPFELDLEIVEAPVGLEIRVLLLHDHQAAQRPLELVLGLLEGGHLRRIAEVLAGELDLRGLG